MAQAGGSPGCTDGQTDRCAHVAEHLPWSIVPISILRMAPGPPVLCDTASQPPRSKRHQILGIFRPGTVGHKAPEVAK